MSKVIRIKKTTEKLLEALKTEYEEFYISNTQTKNESLKEIAKRELQRTETYEENDWIQFALYQTIEHFKNLNTEEKI